MGGNSIRKNTNKKNKYQKTSRGIVNSWSFYQFQNFLKYKAALIGIKVSFIDPHNTSSHCSKCGLEGIRDKKSFKCPNCGHVDHADVNAAYNISKVNCI